jgi:hypothetical protein
MSENEQRHLYNKSYKTLLSRLSMHDQLLAVSVNKFITRHLTLSKSTHNQLLNEPIVNMNEHLPPQR